MAKAEKNLAKKAKKRHTVQYDRWGYFFIAPFFLVYIIFSLIPLLTTFIYSFFESYRDGMNQIGPNTTVYKYFNVEYGKKQESIEKTTKKFNDMIVTYKDDDPVTIIISDDIKDKIISRILEIEDTINKSEDDNELITVSKINKDKLNEQLSKIVFDGIRNNKNAKDIITAVSTDIKENAVNAKYFKELNDITLAKIDCITQSLDKMVNAYGNSNPASIMISDLLKEKILSTVVTSARNVDKDKISDKISSIISDSIVNDKSVKEVYKLVRDEINTTDVLNKYFDGKLYDDADKSNYVLSKDAADYLVGRTGIIKSSLKLVDINKVADLIVSNVKSVAKNINKENFKNYVVTEIDTCLKNGKEIDNILKVIGNELKDFTVIQKYFDGDLGGDNTNKTNYVLSKEAADLLITNADKFQIVEKPVDVDKLSNIIVSHVSYFAKNIDKRKFKKYVVEEIERCLNNGKEVEDIIKVISFELKDFTVIEKYFNGQMYDKNIETNLDRLAKATKSFDKIISSYKDESLSIFIPEVVANKIVSDVKATTITINESKYNKKVVEIINSNIKKEGTVKDICTQSVSEIGKSQAAIVRNFETAFNPDDNIAKYFWNTFVMWILGFIPQIVISLVLAVWFTNTELRLKCQQFFKTVIYMPNLIMAAAFAMLFFTLFSPAGPISGIYQSITGSPEPYRFFNSVGWTRSIVAIMNFLMWYGNTTILLMAGVMGIDNSLFEAARIDGASPTKIFFKITIPLLLPIFVYVLITSLIGGIQMFDVPQILSNGNGNPNRSIMTIIMKLNKHLGSKNFGPAGVTSVLLFIITGILSAFVYKNTMKKYQAK